MDELGTSLSVKPGQDILGGSVRHSASKSLRFTGNLASSLTDLREQPAIEDGELGKLLVVCLFITLLVLYFGSRSQKLVHP